jgi:hypothetical protein
MPKYPRVSPIVHLLPVRRGARVVYGFRRTLEQGREYLEAFGLKVEMGVREPRNDVIVPMLERRIAELQAASIAAELNARRIRDDAEAMDLREREQAVRDLVDVDRAQRGAMVDASHKGVPLLKHRVPL